MVILEYPVAFGLLPQWLGESGHPVVDNACAREVAASGFALNLVPESEAARRIDEGERVYTSSETALDWVMRNTHAGALKRAIETCKDKAALRAAIAPMDPGLFYRRCTAAELPALDFTRLRTPFIVKPNRGYCSVGVHVVRDRRDWERVIADVGAGAIESAFDEDVVDTGEYILEGYIEGDEYALDLYYDGEGAAHVLNVLRHDFASAGDTSDRLYLTSPVIVARMRPLFEEWLGRANAYLGFRDFCIHAEVRVEGRTVRPIEFNPLRFAGMGGTDVSRYAYGYRTYAEYLEGRVPGPEAFAAAAGKVFAMSFIMPPAGLEGAQFELARFAARFRHVLAARPLDTAATGAWAFIFAWEDEAHAARLQELATADLAEYAIHAPI